MRPADAVETFECWQVALGSRQAPSLLALTRQGVPQLRADAAGNRCAQGAYVLREASGARDITILATGSEVQLAVAARRAPGGGWRCRGGGFDAVLGAV